MDIIFKILLTGLVIWLPMLILDAGFDICDRKTKRNEWYANIGAIVMISNVAGWLVYLLASIWLYA